MFLYIDLPRFDFPVVFSEPASTLKPEISIVKLTGTWIGGTKYTINVDCADNCCSNTDRTCSSTFLCG